MRPMPGDDSHARRAASRTTSFTDNEPTPLARTSQPPQTTYFLADENSIGVSQPLTSPVHPKQAKSSSTHGSTYGVESLESVISSLSQDTSGGDDQAEAVRNARRNWRRNLGVSTGSLVEDMSEPQSPLSDDMSRNVSPSYHRGSSEATISRPFTPLSYGSPAPASMLGSPRSRRYSDAGSYTDDNASQAILSSGDDDRDVAPEVMIDSGSAPQLVMPTMKMPSRRPFTEKGKNMGRLKVLIAGDSATGKTALIKAIVQACEDIVHVDPLSTTPVSIPQSRRASRTKSRNRSTDMQTTMQITEIYASTKAYPSWWSDLEESRILRRRKSMGDSVLERNLCFVDTPGYGNKTSCLEAITPVVDYVESQLQKAISNDVGTSEMISMLGGNGGSQVDLVFYIFTQRVKSVDIEYLRRLSQLTNILPLISRSDTLTAEQLESLKENINCELQANNIKTFSLGLSPESNPQSTCPMAPYAISTQPSKDEETMDASLLMSPDYIQPLLPSELNYLVSQIFERDTMLWLRHSAAKKAVQLRPETNVDRPLSLYRPLSQSTSLIAASSMLTGPIGATNSYTLARVQDHSQREERMAQIRLSNWAADLNRSIQNERRQFEALKISERAIWLTERLGECVEDGTIIPISQSRRSSSAALAKHSKGYSRRRKMVNIDSSMGVDPIDPLGLLQLNEDMKRRAIFALRVVGSFGIIGGLAFWFSRGRETWEWRAADADAGVGDWLGRLGTW